MRHGDDGVAVSNLFLSIRVKIGGRSSTFDTAGGSEQIRKGIEREDQLSNKSRYSDNTIEKEEEKNRKEIN